MEEEHLSKKMEEEGREIEDKDMDVVMRQHLSDD
jgi:hypothetical protein